MNMNSIIKFLLGLIGVVDDSDELLCATFKFCGDYFSREFTERVEAILGDAIVNVENCQSIVVWQDGRVVDGFTGIYATVYSFKRSAIEKAKAVYEEDYRKYYS